MTMTATYPGQSDDPTWDSREVRKVLTPIANQLRILLDDVERALDASDGIAAADFNDEGRHGD